MPSNRAAMLTPSPIRSPSLSSTTSPEMDADPKFDALVGCDLCVALDHRPLDFYGAVHRIDDATELNDAAVAGALDDAAVMHGDSRGRSGRCEGSEGEQGFDPRRPRPAANSRRHRTPRSRLVCGSRSSRPSRRRDISPKCQPESACFIVNDRSCVHFFRSRYQLGREAQGRNPKFKLKHYPITTGKALIQIPANASCTSPRFKGRAHGDSHCVTFWFEQCCRGRRIRPERRPEDVARGRRHDLSGII